MATIKLLEDQAAKIVLAAIKEATREMRRLMDRYLLEGRAIDRKMLMQATAELSRLADEYSTGLASGPWGKMIADAAKDGAASVEGGIAALSKKQIDAALWNAKVQIKDILEDGIKVVNRTITRAMVTGDSLREISDTLHSELTIKGEGISAARADAIARNELFSNYRQFSKASADEAGFTLFKMTGPVDSRISAICAKHVGKVKTAKEWEKISPVVFQYGLHPNCRHGWDPVLTREG